MYLQHLSILNYKNIQQAEMTFSSNVNCFVGENGQGKTNILDAIYYLSFCKSHTTITDLSNINHQEDFFMLQGIYLNEINGIDKVTCSAKRGGRKHIKVNDKDIKRISDYWGRIPLVLISPSDSSLVLGGSEERRRFMDITISQYDRTYLEHLIRYEKALKQRNVLLKQDEEPDWAVVDVLEDIMSISALYVFERRKELIAEFIPIFYETYQKIGHYQSETIDIVYSSHGYRGDLKSLLVDCRSKERIVGYTLHGIHKDNLELMFNGYPIKYEGSQGQTKTCFIALKLAQFLFLKKKGEITVPILLLDDIFDKLDASRVSKIIDLVSGNNFGQIFITDTNREHIDSILESIQNEYKLFQVSGGVVKMLH